MKKYNSLQEKLGFYYNYFGKKRESGIECITTMEIASDINKSKANVSNDLTNLIKSPGRRNYGYNTTFIYKQLQKIMHLNEPCYIVLIGPYLPFIDVEMLKKRNFFIKEQKDVFSEEVFEDNTQLLILTTTISQEEFNSIPENICGILNLSGKHYETEKPYYEVNILSMILDLWIDTINLDSIQLNE